VKHEQQTQLPEQHIAQEVSPLWRRAAQRAGHVALAATGALFGGALLVNATSYEGEIAGIGVNAEITMDGVVSLDTSVGSVEFSDITGLPIGASITPQVDLTAIQVAAADMPAFTTAIAAEGKEFGFDALRHYALMGGAGMLAGAFVADVMRRYMSGRTWDAQQAKRSAAGAAVGALTAVTAMGGVGALTYNPDWMKSYELTKMLAEAAALPTQYQEITEIDKVKLPKQLVAIQNMQELLTSTIEEKTEPEAALNILLISDVHMRTGAYAYLEGVVEEQGIDLVINTGDETNFGATQELTDVFPQHLDAIRSLTEKVPMIWVKGNHDSAAVKQTIDDIPGVTVLDKQVVEAFGLTIGGIGDPRHYGKTCYPDEDSAEAETAQLCDETSEAIERYERRVLGKAAAELPDDTYYDIMLSHDPRGLDELAQELGPDRVRMTIGGHMHKQELTEGPTLAVTEGSTGMNGSFGYAENGILAYSILAVDSDCQFTSLKRYQLQDPVTSSGSPYGNNASIQQIYLESRDLEPRTCSVYRGIDEEPTDWSLPTGISTIYAQTPEQESAAEKATP